MTTLKGVAIVALWRSGKFDTADIAHAVGLHEAEVCRVIAIARELERQRREAA